MKNSENEASLQIVPFSDFGHFLRTPIFFYHRYPFVRTDSRLSAYCVDFPNVWDSLSSSISVLFAEGGYTGLLIAK